MGDRDERGDRSPPAGDVNEVFDALRNRWRRYALYYLEEEGEAGLPELVSHVVAYDHGTDPDDVSIEEVQRVYLEFYHQHLPLLESIGVVEYSDDDGQVRLLDQRDRLDRYLELARQDEGPIFDPHAH